MGPPPVEGGCGHVLDNMWSQISPQWFLSQSHCHSLRGILHLSFAISISSFLLTSLPLHGQVPPSEGPSSPGQNMS